MRLRRAALRFAIAVTLGVLQACATTQDGELAASKAKAVPPAAEIPVAKAAPIGEDTIGRYGGEFVPQASAGTVTPLIILMPVTPSQYAAQGTGRLYDGHAAYPPPGQAAPPQPPFAEAAGRGIAGGLIGGVIGAQLGSGSGRHVAAGVGAAAGTMIGMGTSGNPCASPNFGTVAGATAGGVLGNQIGSGSGRTAATAFGALVGAIAGTHAGATAPGCN
jgi:hypothetical protein